MLIVYDRKAFLNIYSHVVAEDAKSKISPFQRGCSGADDVDAVEQVDSDAEARKEATVNDEKIFSRNVGAHRHAVEP